MRPIVLTGGPGAGKTTAAAFVAARLGEHVAMVPESATAVYRAHQTRWDRLDIAGRFALQAEMYRHQLAQEAQHAEAYPGRTLILDRGTIDGAAYWPDGADAFWPAMNTTRQAELDRYEAVVWLETAAALGLYDGDSSNNVRFEDAAGAIASGELLLTLWAGHRKLIRVAAEPAMDGKLAAVLGVVERLVSE